MWLTAGNNSELKYLEVKMTNYSTEIYGSVNSPEPAGKFRLILGLIMMFAGLYFGLFTETPGHGLGLLSFIVSPFVILTDKKRTL